MSVLLLSKQWAGEGSMRLDQIECPRVWMRDAGGQNTHAGGPLPSGPGVARRWVAFGDRNRLGRRGSGWEAELWLGGGRLREGEGAPSWVQG